jgi:hypothetical protein
LLYWSRKEGDEQDRANFESWWEVAVDPAPSFNNGILTSAGFLSRCRDAISRFRLDDRLCDDTDVTQCLGPDLLAFTSFTYLPAGVTTPPFERAATFHVRLLCSYTASVGASLFVTSSGYVGLSYQLPEVGDHVALLAGAKFPLILRWRKSIG